MTIDFACPHCGTTVETRADRAGRTSRCPACEGQVLIPQPQLKAGLELAGYKLVRLLGHGGMGQVYEAEQCSLRRRVALKILTADLAENLPYLRRFHQEVRLLAKLEHPHIVRAYGAGEEDGFHYLSMQLVQGETMADLLIKQGPITEADAINLALPVAEALQMAVNKHGILHRDIKPANLMLDEDGKVLILDLGISRTVNQDCHLTIDGEVVGTPHYMSPEQALGKPLDCRSDIYSLGATLYVLLTGELPHAGSNTMNILSKVVLEDPVPIRALRPDLSWPMAQLIQRMMARDTEARFSTWDEVISALQTAAAWQPAGNRPPWRRWHLKTVAVLLLIGYVAVTALSLRPAAPPAKAATAELQPTQPEPPAPSPLPLHQRLRQLVRSGQLNEAKALLEREGYHLPVAQRQRLEIMLERRLSQQR